MNILQSLTGTVTVQVTGANIPGSLELLAKQDIFLQRVRMIDELSVEITLYRKDFRLFRKLLTKRGDQVILKERSGLYWTVKAVLGRPVLILGLLGLLLLSLWLPSRVLFVQVEGNDAVPGRLILDAASRCGICFGASRVDVRSEQVKNALLEQVPQLQWAGVNTAGCVAKISVRERPLEENAGESSSFGHVVAGLDGVIVSATATRGTLLCAPGQAVSAGDILISGFTDCGLAIRAEQAQGEIYARTHRTITAVSPGFSLQTGEKGEVKKKISLLIGKKRINLWKDSGIWDTTCDRMYEEYYVTLPGGFQLPVALTVEWFVQRNTVPAEIPQEEAECFLADFSETFLKGEMVAGRIRTAEHSFQTQDAWICMTGQYDCEEMIGFMQRQQIGEQNGKND